jgi:hypothetical protein
MWLGIATDWMIEFGSFGEPGLGELHAANPSIVGTRTDRDEALPLKGPQHSTHIARIEGESGAQCPHLGAFRPDLPESPRLTHRPGATQESVI